MTTHMKRHFDHDVASQSRDYIGWAKIILLFGLGIDLLLLIVMGNLTYYISPHFAWLTHVASALLLFFGALSLYDMLRSGHQYDEHHEHHHHDDHHDEHHEHHHHDHEHHHEEITWSILAVIALPLLFGILMPAEPLSAESINGGISMSSVGVAQEDINRIPAEERTIIDWLRLFDASEDMDVFEGQTVEVIGFIYEEPGFGSDHTMIVRFTISCCVADALAIGLPIDRTTLDVPAVGTWVRIRGTFQVGEFDGSVMPVIIPTEIELIPIPDDPYLYT